MDAVPEIMETQEKPVITSPPQKSDSLSILLVHIALIFLGQIVLMVLIQSTVQFLTLQDRIPTEELVGKSFEELQEIQKQVTIDVTEELKSNPEKINNRFYEIVFQEKPGVLFWTSLLWVVSFLLPGLYVLGRRMKIPISKLEDSFSLNILGFGVVGGIIVFLMVGALGMFLNLIDFKPQNNAFQTQLFQNMKGNSVLLAWSVYSVGIVTGIIEEWFFRGMLLRHYISRGLAQEGLMITSLMFGALHFSSDASLVVPVILSGVGYYFGSFYLKTGNIWAPIIAHSTYNSIGLVLAYFVGDLIT